jgi:hypothetical protein
MFERPKRVYALDRAAIGTGFPKIHYNIISHLFLVLPSGFFPSVFPTTILQKFLISPMRVAFTILDEKSEGKRLLWIIRHRREDNTQTGIKINMVGAEFS